MRVAVWIIGEYSVSQSEIDRAFDTIRRNIGTLPVFEAKKEEEEKASAETKGPRTITKTIIMPDGSYGTETIVLDD